MTGKRRVYLESFPKFGLFQVVYTRGIDGNYTEVRIMNRYYDIDDGCYKYYITGLSQSFKDRIYRECDLKSENEI